MIQLLHNGNLRNEIVIVMTNAINMSLPLRLPPSLASNQWYSSPYQSQDQPSLNRTLIMTKTGAINIKFTGPFTVTCTAGGTQIMKSYTNYIKFGHPCVWNGTYQCSCVHDRWGWHTCRISSGSPHHSTDSCRFIQKFNYDFQEKKVVEKVKLAKILKLILDWRSC